MQVVIDDFENQVARLETAELEQLIIPRAWLPSDARPGDHLQIDADQAGLIQITIDHQATQAAFEAARESLESLTASDDGKDLQL